MFIFAGLASAARFAVLFAGSNDWINYRHQADTYTLYNMLLANGYPADHIIMSAYNDLTTHRRNKFPGQVFHSLSHVNVYPGLAAHSFSGADVTAAQFYSTLLNLPTTAQDNIFVYYNNHGAEEMLGVPEPNGDIIWGSDLASTFNQMGTAGAYLNILFVIEACYSGSIGNLINVPRMATITAANAVEESYAFGYDPSIGVYLTDEFTFRFFTQMELNPTLDINQFIINVQAGVTSHVCYYGATSIKSLPMSDFIGIPPQERKTIKFASVDSIATQVEATLRSLATSKAHESALVRSQATLAEYMYKANHEKLVLTLELITKLLTPTRYEAVLTTKGAKFTPEYKEVTTHFLKLFKNINADDLPLLRVFKNLALEVSKDKIINAIDTILASF